MTPSARHRARHRRPATVAALAGRPAVAASLTVAVLGSTAAGYSAVRNERVNLGPSTTSAAMTAMSMRLVTPAPHDTATGSIGADASWRAQGPAAARLVGQARAQARAAITRARRAHLAAEVAMTAGASRVVRPLRAAQVRGHAWADRAGSRSSDGLHQVHTSGDPRAVAASMLSSYGWSSDQFGCLSSLWQRESGWRLTASNPSSGAYGIPQALPGSKMASAGSDWQTNPVTQIRWGLGYIRDSYGSPCGAWAHSLSSGWY